MMNVLRLFTLLPLLWAFAHHPLTLAAEEQIAVATQIELEAQMQQLSPWTQAGYSTQPPKSVKASSLNGADWSEPGILFLFCIGLALVLAARLWRWVRQINRPYEDED